MKKKEIRKRTKRVKGILLLTAFLAVFIIFILSLQNAAAQRYGCCYKRLDGKYCEEGYEGIDCDTANFLGGNCTDSRNAAKCGLVTCALDYDCMFNIKKGKCLYEHKGTVAKGDECVKECCGIAGRSYGIKTHRACKNTAFKKGFNESYIEFVATTDEQQCAAHFEPTVKGCCITAGGCEDTTREECKGDFHADILCKKIPTKCQVSEIGLKCGKQPGNENKVVLLDSAGGEEVKYTCSLPQYRCLECSEDVCDFVKSANPGRTIVEYFEGYCADTSCSLTEFEEFGEKVVIEKGKLKQQTVTKDGKIKVIEPITYTLQTGQSICYNFYGVSSAGKGIDKEKHEGDANVFYMSGRSTGLQNHKLVCNYGTIQVIGLGDDRKVLCKDDPSVYIAKKVTNEDPTKLCGECGKLKGGFMQRILDPLGDFVSAGWMLGGVLGRAISEQCDHKKCAKIKSPEGEQLCFYSQDTNIRFWGANPVGSCVPRFSPGTSATCGICGGGFVGEKGGDAWNICKEEECYALGNCQFKYSSPLRGTLTFITSLIGFYGANRIGGTLFEGGTRAFDKCVIQDIDKCHDLCALDPSIVACRAACMGLCMVREYVPSTKDALVDSVRGPFTSGFAGLGGLKHIGKWLWDQVWDVGKGIVTGKVNEAVTKGVTGATGGKK